MAAVPKTFSESLARIVSSLQASAYIPAMTLVVGATLVVNIDRVDEQPPVLGPNGQPLEPPAENLLDGLEAFADYGFSELLIGFGLVFAVSVLLEPLQFSLIRLMEGYWGSSRLTARARRHLLERNTEHFDRLQKETQRLAAAQQTTDPDSADFVVNERTWELIQDRLSHLPARHRLMPTPLGNRLRAWEDRASEGPGDRIEEVLPIIFHALPEEVRRQHDYHRTALDLYCTLIPVWAVLAATAAVALSATTTTFALVVGLVAAIPLTHRAAMTSADGYGEQLVAARKLLLLDTLDVGSQVDAA